MFSLLLLLFHFSDETRPFYVAMEMTELKELDLRATKKQVCKITPELVDALKQHYCKIRGGVIKKSKGKKKASSA